MQRLKLAWPSACLLMSAACAAHGAGLAPPEPQVSVSTARPTELAANRPTPTYVRTEVIDYGEEGDPCLRRMDVFLLVNPTRDVYEYWGDDPAWPLYRRQLLTEHGWADDDRPICGASLQVHALAPGASIEFTADAVTAAPLLDAGASYAGATRVGLRVKNRATGSVSDVWSASYAPAPLDQLR